MRRSALLSLPLLWSCSSDLSFDPNRADGSRERQLWTQTTPVPCPSDIPASDPMRALFREHGLDTDVGITKERYRWFGGRIADDPTRLPHFHELQANITQIPCWGANVAARADEAVASAFPLTTAIADAATSLALSVSVGGRPDAPAGETPLLDALDRFMPAGWDRTATAAELAQVPLEHRRATARVVLASVEASRARDAALTAILAPEHWPEAYLRGADAAITHPDSSGLSPDDPRFEPLYVATPSGHGALYQGAIDLASVVDLIDWEALATPTPFAATIETPLGRIVLRGGGDDRYDDGDPLLAGPILFSLDTGGNDRYQIAAGATGSADHPVGIHVDLGGDDDYGYREMPSPNDRPTLLPSDRDGRWAGNANFGPLSRSEIGRQGSGVLGYGFLLDLGGGRDVYRSLRKSQGFSHLGVGILLDDGGDDQYFAESGAQGSAIVGIAALLDGGGNDTYHSYGGSQAFGFVSSFGLLHDESGDDNYELVVNEDVLFYSPQLPGTHNSSRGQGFAFGWRRDSAGDRHYSGGIAVLRDVRGDDYYEGSVFVQGGAYWMGTGVLSDGEGNDRYNGKIYAQGAAAHFGVAAFLEGGGDDIYNGDADGKMRMFHSSIGLAHDYSVTFFVEGGGNDTYNATDRGIANSKCHGMSFFVDDSGDDLYRATGLNSLVWATDFDGGPAGVGNCGTSNDIPSYAFFVDSAGRDRYESKQENTARDGASFVNDDLSDPDALELAAGWDGEGPPSFARALGVTP